MAAVVRQRHGVVAASFAIQFIAWGTYASFAVFIAPWVSEFGWARSAISNVASVSFLLIGTVGVAMGILNDRLGPRYIITWCGLCCGGALMWISRATSLYEVWFAYGIVMAVGMGGMNVVLLTTVSRHFPSRQGRVSGIVTVGTGLGNAIMPSVAAGLVLGSGWRMASMILGFMGLLIITLGAQFLRRAEPAAGLSAEGEKVTGNQCAKEEREHLSFRDAIRTRQFWIVCLVYVAIFMCIRTIMVHLVPYAIDTGSSAQGAAGLLGIAGGASVLGRLLIGSAGDRIGCKQSLILSLCILLTALAILQVGTSWWLLCSFAIAYGFAHGGLFAVMSPAVAELFGTSSHGRLLGVVLFAGTMGGSLGPLLAGYLFDGTGSYRLDFWILLLLSLGGLCLATRLKPSVGITK